MQVLVFLYTYKNEVITVQPPKHLRIDSAADYLLALST
jgi:hypothetical protein